MFWLIDKVIDTMTCFMLDIITGESHAHFFKEEAQEVTERKNKDTYIWDF